MNPETATGWMLHPQLERDTHAAGDLPLCRVLLIDDANFPWLLLVPRRAGAREVIDLGAADRAVLIEEIAQASGALRELTSCDKLNVAALGNAVPQLHVHVIARFRGDAAWPRPVWGAAAPQPYDRGRAEDAIARPLRRSLSLAAIR